MNGLYLRNVVVLEACSLGCLVPRLIHENTGFSLDSAFVSAGKEQSSRDTSGSEILPMTVRTEGEDLMEPAGLLVLQ